MKRIKLILLSGLLITLALVFPVNAAVTVVNFDELVGQNIVPDGYAGLNWDPNWWYYGWDQSPWNAHSPPNRIYSYYPAWIGFSNPVYFKGAWLAGTDTQEIYFEGYKNGVKIGQSSTLTLSETPIFLDSGFSTDIDKVVVVCSSNFGFALDDITYEDVINAPEFPSAFLPAAMIIGFLGAVLLIQRTTRISQ